MPVHRALVLSVLFGASAAYACRCSKVEDPKVAYSRAQAVVRGKVVKLTKVPSRRGARVQFQVVAAWKRAVPSRLPVATLDLCSYPLKLGEEYVLFLVSDVGQYVTTRCMGNASIDEAAATLDWLSRNGEATHSR